MNRALKKMVGRLYDFLAGAIREGTTQPADKKKPPMSGHVLLMRLAAARSLIADNIMVDEAATIVGVEPEELRRWLARHRVRRS